MAQLAARLRARQGGADGPGGGVIVGEDGETVIMDDNCSVSVALAFGFISHKVAYCAVR